METLLPLQRRLLSDSGESGFPCFVADDYLTPCFLLLMETNGLAGGVVNLGNPEEHTILQFAQCIVELSGSDHGIVYEPLPQDDPQRRRPDISKAQRLLGWEPQIELEDGLRQTLAFFQEKLRESERFV